MTEGNNKQRCCTGGTGSSFDRRFSVDFGGLSGDLSEEQEARLKRDIRIEAVRKDLQDNPARPARPVFVVGQALQEKHDIDLWALLGWAVRDQLVLQAYASDKSGAAVVQRHSTDIPDFGDIGVRVDISAKGEMVVHDDAVTVMMAVYEALTFQHACELFDYVNADMLPRFVSELPPRRLVPLLRGERGLSARDFLALSDVDYWEYLNEFAPDWNALCDRDVSVRYSPTGKRVFAWDVRQVGSGDADILADSLALCTLYERFYSHMSAIYEILSTTVLRRYRLCEIGVCEKPWLE